MRNPSTEYRKSYETLEDITDVLALPFHNVPPSCTDVSTLERRLERVVVVVYSDNFIVSGPYREAVQSHMELEKHYSIISNWNRLSGSRHNPLSNDL